MSLPGSADNFRILAISGSIRRASFNRGLVLAAQECAPETMDVEIADISALPHYNADHDGDAAPPSVREFCHKMREADAMLISTPEYNHSLPGVLKNALDWAGSSRSKPAPPLRAKAIALVGAGPGKSGSIRAQMAIKIVLAACRCHVLMGHEMFLQNASSLFDADGKLIDASVKASLREILAALEKLSRSLAASAG